MKITPQILSIPPYLSTTWKNIAALHTVAEADSYRLFVLFYNQTQAEVPGLSKREIDLIFAAHALYLRGGREETSLLPLPGNAPLAFSIEGFRPLFGGAGDSTEIFAGGLHHNPAQANLPPLPADFLEKITAMLRSLQIAEGAMPPAESDCSCIYCQIARNLHESPPSLKEEAEEETVSEEELTFRTWDIEQKGKELYTVTHPLDKAESYTVFLGTPLGCTCGNKDCEHIQAVLRS